MDDDGGAAAVGPSPIHSGTGANTASVGCTEGRGSQNQNHKSESESSFGENRSSLMVINPWLLGRTDGASGTGDLQ